MNKILNLINLFANRSIPYLLVPASSKINITKISPGNLTIVGHQFNTKTYFVNSRHIWSYIPNFDKMEYSITVNERFNTQDEEHFKVYTPKA